MSRMKLNFLRKIKTMSFVFIAMISLVVVAPSAAQAILLGPSPYLEFSDSPFSVTDFSGGYFHLEDFEDHLLNTPGVSASTGSATSISFSDSFIDSVDGDDGDSSNGSCLDCDSFFNFGLGRNPVTFTFDASVLGHLPTHAGIVWTDGEETTLFEAFNAFGISLGTIGPVSVGDGSPFIVSTSEDRFFGVSDLGGISRIVIGTTSHTRLEVDHLQYGAVSGVPVPEPSTMILLGSGLISLLGFNYKRNKKDESAF